MTCAVSLKYMHFLVSAPRPLHMHCDMSWYNKHHEWYTFKNIYLLKSFSEEITFDSSSFVFTSSFVEKRCKDEVFERKWHLTYMAWRDHPFEFMFFLHIQSIFIELIPYRIGFCNWQFSLHLVTPSDTLKWVQSVYLCVYVHNWSQLHKWKNRRNYLKISEVICEYVSPENLIIEVSMIQKQRKFIPEVTLHLIQKEFNECFLFTGSSISNSDWNQYNRFEFSVF
jgi:hypothetical protein